MSALTLGILKNQEKLLELGHLSVSESCIYNPPKYKLTNTLLEDLPIWAIRLSINKLKYTFIMTRSTESGQKDIKSVCPDILYHY
jgi:hypothetical protein